MPQGYGHYIEENTGEDELQVVLMLNNATYQSISITAWMAGTPDLVLATNFSLLATNFSVLRASLKSSPRAR